MPDPKRKVAKEKVAVDRWVITKVFKWMADHRNALEDIAAFTINLSGQSVTDDSFIGFVLEQMNNTQIPQKKVVGYPRKCGKYIVYST
ncbi:MAG: hypothetical protein HYX62_09855 [Gammaproteobacteria bacterium]|nr:hypothetical protein [Gammaproteobacteria bacterium]